MAQTRLFVKGAGIGAVVYFEMPGTALWRGRGGDLRRALIS